MTLFLKRVRYCYPLFVFLVVSHAIVNASEASHRVTVTVLRHESSIRTSVGNRDAYVVRVQPKGGVSFVARIVDRYPGYSDTALIPAAENDSHLSVALRRAPYCDSGQIETDSTDQMRCFEVVHGSWRLPKQAEDQWWK